MTYEQAKRIIATSSYTAIGTALVSMDLLSQQAYETDYNNSRAKMAYYQTQSSETETIRLATIIQDNRRDK